MENDYDPTSIVIENLGRLGIECLIVIGGDDTLSFASVLSDWTEHPARCAAGSAPLRSLLFGLGYRDMTLWLEAVPSHLREKAREAFEKGEAAEFVSLVSNESGLQLVLMNAYVLEDRGMYEDALLEAWYAPAVNTRGVPLRYLEFLFSRANRERLLAAGDRVPGLGPFQLFRGVAGSGRARRVRGLSWTDSYERAFWFASRFTSLRDPAVFQIHVELPHIFAYLNRRKGEQEFIVDLPEALKPTRVA
jgi:hypothetical protein